MGSELADALAAWNKAPLHIRAWAGDYVGPLLAALVAHEKRLEKLEEVSNGKS